MLLSPMPWAARCARPVPDHRVIAAFLLLPVVFIVLLSFGSSRGWSSPPGWTLKWYGQFFSNPEWMEAALASFKVAVLTTVAAVLLGLPARSPWCVAASRAVNCCTGCSPCQ